MSTHMGLTTLKWIKRLEPFADESLAGFLGRWAQANYLNSRGHLLNAVGVSRAIRLTHTELEKLSVPLGLDLAALVAIAPANLPVRPVLRRSHTRPDSEAVCPQCLSESPYSRQLWSHCMATACPSHGTRLLDHCQRCKKSVRVDRPLPHLCECGADLRLQRTDKATQRETDFSTLLMGQKPTEATFPFDLSGGVPEELDLFVWGMANHFAGDSSARKHFKAGKLPLPKTVEQAVAKLSPLFALLDDWPNRFDANLEQMMNATQTVASTGVAEKLGRWYFFLFRKYPHDAFRPVRVAAANRIVQSHDGLLNARTHSVQLIATVQKNWYSVKEAAAELRISADRINAGIDRCLIAATVHDESAGYRQRFLSLDEITRLQQVQFEHINDTEAIAVLNVPRAIYNLMCQAGWIERADTNDVAPVVSGYIKHVRLLGLIERLRNTAQTTKGRKVGASVPLRKLNLRRTTDLQRLIGLFRAIASGELTPVDHDEILSIGGLMFAQDEVDKRIAAWYVERGLTLQQVSELTGAHYDAVKGWIEMGLLAATREPTEQGAPWVINVRDLIDFLQTYVPLARQATACKSTTRGLTSRLESLGVNPIEPEHAARGSLLRLSDLFNAVKNPDVRLVA